jgi:hypothetical protein
LQDGAFGGIAQTYKNLGDGPRRGGVVDDLAVYKDGETVVAVAAGVEFNFIKGKSFA